MAEKIKFYTDEHVSKAVVNGLRMRGVDVLTVVEANMLGATDDQHLMKATQEGRVIFTQDDDFLRLHAEGNSHAGIVYVRQGTSTGKVIAGLMLIHQVLSDEDMVNHIEYL